MSRVAQATYARTPFKPTKVRGLFDTKVARYVDRVMWHPTQKFRRTADGLEITMDVAGTVEVSNWVLGFGDMETVLSPPALWTALADQLSRALDRYRA